MTAILDFFRNHGTKVIGGVQGTIAAVCGVTGIIPDAHLKYWLAASAVLTFWRGFVNSASQK
jgi:hypothetical protein